MEEDRCDEASRLLRARTAGSLRSLAVTPGIKVLDAKETLGKGELPQLVVDNLKIQAA